MYQTIHDPDFKAPIKTWLPPEEIELGALDQLKNAAKHADVGPHVAVMPDCHVGFGVTIGCVFPTVDAPDRAVDAPAHPAPPPPSLHAPRHHAPPRPPPAPRPRDRAPGGGPRWAGGSGPRRRRPGPRGGRGPRPSRKRTLRTYPQTG